MGLPQILTPKFLP